MSRQTCFRGILFLNVALLTTDISAVDLDLTFKANIKETTCDMYISGGTASGELANNTVITIGPSGQVRLDEILQGTSGTGNNTAGFSLNIKECPPGLTSIKTKVTASPLSPSLTAIANTATSGAAKHIGLTISRMDQPEQPFILNSEVDAQRLTWTTAELSTGKVDLLARLVLIGSDTSETTGNYSGTAIFNFTYN
ncbi:fimbrial protein [Obesumbacterium proteus]|uniref:fimbrial protein n=1 Tax=Obesumbacterium proteus TaxID=82983 RepID=UPI0010346CC3|nr:fimbrial protein [Obesumbacterium proteus]TBL78901.1 fimbrial protein [Obesumbacterium proteus]